MSALIKNEIYKILKQKKLYIFMGVAFFLAIFSYINILIVKSSSVVMDSSGQLNALKSMYDKVNGQSFPLVVLSMISTALVIYITILLSDIITDEYKNGTLKLSLLRPVSRIKLLNSKIIGVFVGTTILQIFTLIISYILGIIFLGWGDKAIINGVEFSTMNGILVTLGSYFLTLIPYFAFVMVVLFISLLYSSAGATIGTALGLWFLLDILTLIKQVRPFILDKYYTFYADMIKELVWKDLFIGIAVVLGYGIIFYLASTYIFKKKDILM